MAYDLKPFDSPALSGLPLRIACVLAEMPGVGALIRTYALSQLGAGAFRARPHRGVPTVAPILPQRASLEETSKPAGSIADAKVPAATPPEGSFRFETAADFTAAYREGRTTPSAVAERVLAAQRALDEGPLPLRVMISVEPDDVRALASAATERWKKGEPLGPLDGVPVAVKDEVHQIGYRTTVGTRFLGTAKHAEDATVVARMRAAGAVLIGKANMHEIGIGVTGLNPHYGACRNPYDPARATGGSSSGSAAAVSAGLCPVSVGADGGGSIRIPSATCGVFGLKATHGRVPEHGAAPLTWSVGHLGPIGATAADLAEGYRVLAGPDPHDPWSMRQPPPDLAGLEVDDLKGIRLGVYPAWFRDAEPAIVARCEEVLERLKGLGAEVIEVEVEELTAVRLAHIMTIASEMAAGLDREHKRHRRKYAGDVRMSLTLARALTSRDYVNGQRVRHEVGERMKALFGRIDGLVTPTTACTAPLHPTGAGLRTGVSDLNLGSRLMQFALLGNLTGYPAVTAPAGYDAHGLPVGFQVMGRPWEEALLLRIARLVEAGAPRKAPRVRRRLLEAAAS